MIELKEKIKTNKKDIMLYVDKDIWSKFKFYCKIKNISASAVFEDVMDAILEGKYKNIEKIKLECQKLK